VSAGIDQTTSSMPAGMGQSGPVVSAGIGLAKPETRKQRSPQLVGSTIASMIATRVDPGWFCPQLRSAPVDQGYSSPDQQNGTRNNRADASGFHGHGQALYAAAKPPVTSVRAYFELRNRRTVICGCGSGGIFEALAIPLGSTVTLFRPPMLAAPAGYRLIGTFPIPASPATRANEAAGEPRPAGRRKQLSLKCSTS